MVANAHFDLPPVLDSGAAGDLKVGLLRLRGENVVAAGAAVERAGVLCLQVLVAAQTLWRSEGHSFEIQDASPALVDAARQTGLAGILNFGGAFP